MNMPRHMMTNPIQGRGPIEGRGLAPGITSSFIDQPVGSGRSGSFGASGQPEQLALDGSFALRLDLQHRRVTNGRRLIDLDDHAGLDPLAAKRPHLRRAQPPGFLGAGSLAEVLRGPCGAGGEDQRGDGEAFRERTKRSGRHKRDSGNQLRTVNGDGDRSCRDYPTMASIMLRLVSL